MLVALETKMLLIDLCIILLEKSIECRRYCTQNCPLKKYVPI